MGEPIRQLRVDNRLPSYERYLDDEVTAKFYDGVKPGTVLDRLIIDLVFSWRMTAYVAATPSTFVKAIQSSTLGYAKFTSPDTSIVAFGEQTLREVSRKVPEIVEDRALRAKLMSAIVESADAFRERAVQTRGDVQVSVEPIWEDFLKQDAFYMTLAATQRDSYVAFYNAYEAFLVDCTKVARSADQLRATEKEFMDGLRNSFGTDLTGSCWGTREIQLGREVRHAISHAGGRETKKLKSLCHGMMLVGGRLQIVPDNVKELITGMAKGVFALVLSAKSLPQFAAVESDSGS